MRSQSLLCGLVATADLIPTDIDDLEVKLNLVIFTDQGQVEKISSCPKTPKKPKFQRFTWPRNANFLATHQIDELNALMCCL